MQECLCKRCNHNITDPDYRVIIYQEGYPEILIGPYCEGCYRMLKICSICQRESEKGLFIQEGNKWICESCQDKNL